MKESSTKYKSVVVTKRGGPEVLRVVENDLRPPSAGEARIRILATPVVQDDIAVRDGNRPFLAKIPFVPGYAIIGTVDMKNTIHLWKKYSIWLKISRIESGYMLSSNRFFPKKFRTLDEAVTELERVAAYIG